MGSACFDFDGSMFNHNIISTKLAKKLRIKVGDMGPTLKSKRAFKGQEVAITPLIGKL